MAKSDDTSRSRVTRITARDDTKTKKKSTTNPNSGPKPSKTTSVTQDSPKAKRRGPLRAIIGYFVGSWRELRLVRWPDRPTTWKMTGILLLFTAFLTGLILVLDAGFKYLFQIILGS